MQQSEKQSEKDCLRTRYSGANLATQIVLEKNRLSFLLDCVKFKRPPQSLRVRGLNGLCEEKWKLLVQEIESKALQCAIKEKKELIDELGVEIAAELFRFGC